jgi:hypothetical protein
MAGKFLKRKKTIVGGDIGPAAKLNQPTKQTSGNNPKGISRFKNLSLNKIFLILVSVFIIILAFSVLIDKFYSNDPGSQEKIPYSEELQSAVAATPDAVGAQDTETLKKTAAELEKRDDKDRLTDLFYLKVVIAYLEGRKDDANESIAELAELIDSANKVEGFYKVDQETLSALKDSVNKEVEGPVAE